MFDIFGDEIYRHYDLFLEATPEQLEKFCQSHLDHMYGVSSTLGILEILLLINGVGFLTSFCQQVVGAHLKNVQDIPYFRLIIEFLVFVTSVLNVIIVNQKTWEPMLSTRCNEVRQLDENEIWVMDRTYDLM